MMEEFPMSKEKKLDHQVQIEDDLDSEIQMMTDQRNDEWTVRHLGSNDGSDDELESKAQVKPVDEDDHQHTTELFDGQKSSGGHTLEEFIPKSKDDFLECAELLSQKIRPFEKSFYYMTLVRALMRHTVVSLKASDAKEVASSMTVIANAKLKAEKDAPAGKKKTGPKKKKRLVDEPDDEGYPPGTYDGVDDYESTS